jgi:phosphoribosylanthranilate isomerase
LVKIKICGIMEAEHAAASAAAGADFLGLVLTDSRRRVSVEKAREIVRAIRGLYPRPELVGVFAGSPATEVNRAAAFIGLDRVQLSGRETTEYCRELDYPIIKVIHIMSNTDSKAVLFEIEELNGILLDKKPMFLLDTQDAPAPGGTGKVFDWDLGREICGESDVIVAGGLNASNVGRLLETCSPWGVDVSSGVETEGKKDMLKVKAFIEAVRKYENGKKGGAYVSG